MNKPRFQPNESVLIFIKHTQTKQQRNCRDSTLRQSNPESRVFQSLNADGFYGSLKK